MDLARAAARPSERRRPGAKCATRSFSSNAAGGYIRLSVVCADLDQDVAAWPPCTRQKCVPAPVYLKSKGINLSDMRDVRRASDQSSGVQNSLLAAQMNDWN